MPIIKEELLHHIWQHRLFRQQELRTTDGQVLELVHPGMRHSNAGPDFVQARIRSGAMEWAGNVEIHIKSSDWLRHGHQHDPAYANIILHVVYEDDIREPLGTFPTLELKHLVSDQVLKRYEHLSQCTDGLRCGKQFITVSELTRNAWLDTLLIRRLQRRSERMNALVDQCAGDLEQAFMTVLFRTFGTTVNAEPFEQLARVTPWKVLAKHQNDLFQLEAILFGNAGFLDHSADEHAVALKKEYDFLRIKYGLQPIKKEQWRFLRLRPANFPTLRIAQLAALFHRVGAFYRWFSGLPKTTPAKLKVEPSSYWRTHYNFGKESASRPKAIGTVMYRNILINAVAPFLFVTSKREARPELQDRALTLLQQLDAERNRKVQVFEQQGLSVANALETQALIELKTHFCDHGNCLNCAIGAAILKREL